MNEIISSETHHPESLSRRPTLKKITTLFGRKSDSIATKPPSSSSLSTTQPVHDKESSGQKDGHDWRALDRSSSTHSYATMSSIINSASTGYSNPSLRVSNPPQPDHRQPLTSPPKSPPLNSSSKQGRNLWDEGQRSPTSAPKAKASNHSRPSTGTRQWPSTDLYDIPDEDVPFERDVSAHSRDNRGQGNTSYDHVPGRPPSSGETSRSALMESSSRNTPANSRHRNTNPNSTLDRDVAFGVPSTTTPAIRIPPSQSNSVNTLVGSPLLGIGSFSSSPPRILGGSLRHSPPMRVTHIRSSTTESSQSINANLLAIKYATETRHCILNTASGRVSSGTLEGLVQFLIDGFGKWLFYLMILQC